MQLQPAFSIDQHVDDADALHVLRDQMIDLADAGGEFAGRWFFQDQPAIDDFGIGIFGKLGIDRFSSFQQGRLQCLGKGPWIGFDSRHLTKFGQFAIQGFIVNQLFAIIVVAFTMRDEEVA